MTTLHPIGELLRSGVRPTDEETEHLKALGGFVAEMYGRFMGGHAERLTSAADLWAGRLSGRLSAATGARWEHGLGLAEMLLGSELTNFWRIAREGLTAGYGEFGAEMGMLDLYEDEAQVEAVEELDASPRRRRGSLFGARGKASPFARRASQGGAAGAGRGQLSHVALVAEAQAEDPAGTARQRHWRDGSRAEMAVVKALAAGGLFLGDQVFDSAPGVQGTAGTRAGTDVVPQATGAEPQPVFLDGVRPVFLDGVRIDARTPALASALARVDAVFGRGERGIGTGAGIAAVSQSRLGRLAASADYSIDRGLGSGERPVYGFYDAAETTFLKLADETARVSEDLAAESVRAPGRRAARAMPASALARRADVRGEGGHRGPATSPLTHRPAARSVTLGQAARSVTLDQVVDTGGPTLRPFVGGVFGAGDVGAGAPQADVSIAFASQFTHNRNGLPTVRVQRGGMSAPRYSVVEAGRTELARTFAGGPVGALDAASPDAGWLPGAPVTATSGGFRPAGGVARWTGGVARSVDAQPAVSSIPQGLRTAGSSVSHVAAIPGARVPSLGASEQSLVLGASERSLVDGGQQASQMRVQGAGLVEAGAATVLGPGAPLGAAAGHTGVSRLLDMGIGGGFVLGALGAEGAGADWRLAIDGGRDLPLGATFSRHEAFAGARASQGVADMRAMRSDFRPVIAGGADAERPSELAQALGGMVWVTLPMEGEPGTAVENMGLAAVPSRRAAMVPAGLAFQSIAGIVAGSRPTPVAAGTMASIQGRLDGGALSSAEMVRIAERGAGVAPETQIAARESGVASRPVGSLGDMQFPRSAGEAVRRADEGSELGGAGTSGGVVRAAFDATTFAHALRSGFLGIGARSEAAGIGARSEGAGATVPEIGEVESATFAAVAARSASGSGSLAGRWIEAALRADGLERGLRAARLLDGVVGKGGYGRIENERELLSIAREPVSTPVEGAEAPPTRRSARRLGAAALGRSSVAASPFGRAEMRPGVVRAQPASEGGRQVRHPEGGAARVIGSPDARLSEARVALSRGVVTARESRAVASLFRSLGTLASPAGAQRAVAEHAIGRATQGSDIRRTADDAPLRAVAARGFAGGVAGADEPVLGRIVERLNAVRAERSLTASNWDVPQTIVSRIAGLEGVERRDVQRALAASGWSAPELQMLRIAAPEEATIVAAAVGEGAGGQAGSRGLAQTARAARMSRSMARVLTGGEALGGSVSEKQVGATAGSIAQGMAASWLPLLASGSDSKYFGGLAPSVAGASVATAAGLREAIGDLVKMAEAAVATSDTPVALTARREVLRRAAELETQVSVGADRAMLERILAVAGHAEQTVAQGGDGAPQASALVDALGSRAKAMLAGEQIRGFEDRITELGALADGTIATGFADVAQRTMRVGDDARTMLQLESAAQVGPDGEPLAAKISARTVKGLEARLAKALALSSGGPAGARRMVQSSSPKLPEALAAKGDGASRRALWSREPDEATLVHGTVMSGASPELGRTRSGTEAQHRAALREETQRTLSIMLGSVMAPEAMLGGLRSPELSEAIREVIVRRMTLGDDFVPVLTTLADSGVDLTSARSSISAQAQEALAKKSAVGSVGTRVGEMADEKLGFKSIGRDAEQFRVAKSGLASDAPEQEFLQLMSESEELVGQFGAATTRRQRAGLLSAILRGTERAEMTAILEQAGGRQFAMAWLNRVDGSRSGIDIGMKTTRQEFGQTFGVRRNSSVAGDSPISGASFVDTGAGERAPEDRSGLRSIAAEVVHTATGASRPQHGASQAMRRTDWSFIDTGSRATTAHADLGKLASAIAGSSENSARAPMPLVAPAAKAIAQTALRDDKNSSASSNNSSTGGAPPPPGGPRGPVDAKMSEKAVDMLAIEMANRVARLMGLTNERRGIWS